MRTFTRVARHFQMYLVHFETRSKQTRQRRSVFFLTINSFTVYLKRPCSRINILYLKLSAPCTFTFPSRNARARVLFFFFFRNVSVRIFAGNVCKQSIIYTWISHRQLKNRRANEREAIIIPKVMHGNGDQHVFTVNIRVKRRNPLICIFGRRKKKLRGTPTMLRRNCSLCSGDKGIRLARNECKTSGLYVNWTIHPTR